MVLLAAGGCTEPAQREFELDAGTLVYEGTSTSAGVDDNDEFLDVSAGEWPYPPDIAEFPPAPIRGGTMLLSRDSSQMLVGDELRDEIHVVEVETQMVLRSVSVPGCHPGRMAQASDGTLVVVCTRSGGLLYVDPDAGEAMGAVEVCANPRGLALDENDTAWVACAEGAVHEVREGRIAGRLDVGQELRDVVDAGPPLRVSTFRTPSVLTLDASGEVTDVRAPADVGIIGGEETVPFEASLEDSVTGPLVPNVGRRVVDDGVGGWQMLHQVAQNSASGVTSTAEGWASTSGCVGTQTAALSWVDPETQEVQTHAFPGMGLAFDVALDPDRERFAMVGAVESEWIVVIREPIDGLPTVLPTCFVMGQRSIDSMPTAVEFDADGRAWVFQPEDPGLLIFDPEDNGSPERIRFLDHQSIEDSGFTQFHRPTSAGVACVSCHPEGREDGLRWALESTSPRRTISLAGRLDGGAPFHWGGEQADIASLDAEVRVEAMLGFDRGPEHVEVFERYLFALPAMQPSEDQDPSAVSAGARAFDELGCNACHLAPRYDNPNSVHVPGHGTLQVPSLLGVQYGAPYMHDGRSQNLDVAIADMLEHSQGRVEVTPQRRTDLRAFLLSL